MAEQIVEFFTQHWYLLIVFTLMAASVYLMLRLQVMLQQNMAQIADIAEEDLPFFQEMAQKCPKGFCVKAMANIEKVAMMVDRNVNSKILFTDLVDRMFMNI